MFKHLKQILHDLYDTYIYIYKYTYYYMYIILCVFYEVSVEMYHTIPFGGLNFCNLANTCFLFRQELHGPQSTETQLSNYNQQYQRAAPPKKHPI